MCVCYVNASLTTATKKEQVDSLFDEKVTASPHFTVCCQILVASVCGLY